MLFITKRLKHEALIVRWDKNIDTIKFIQLLVTSLDGDKTLLSSGIENIGAYCVLRELDLVSWIWEIIFRGINYF